MDSQNAISGKAASLRKMLEDRISSFHGRRQKNRSMAFYLKIASTSFGALTTILLGLQFPATAMNPDILKDVALCSSAIVTVVATWDSFFDHKGLWIKYTNVRNQLLAVKAELDYLLSSGIKCSDDQIDPLFHRYQAILENANEAWLQGKSEKNPKSL